MTRNTGRRYELDASVDEAISYYRARQILRKRFTDATEEEFCVWVRLGYLHAFKSADMGQQESSRSASNLFTVADPFAKLRRGSKPIDLLLPYKFSCNEIESFNPTSMGGERNPGGRFLTFKQVVQYAARYADEEYAERLIHREIGSRMVSPIHLRLGTLITRADKLKALKAGYKDVLACLLFPSAWINQLCAEEFKGVKARKYARASDSGRSSLKAATGRRSLGQGNPFRDIGDLRWEQIAMQFVTAETVRISAHGVEGRYTAAEMGFKDKRSREASPNSRWCILRDIFAPTRGEVSYKTHMSEKDRGRLKKAVSDIRKQLQVFFGITNDPFYHYQDVKSYKTKFRLLPDEDSLDNYRALCGHDGDDDDLKSPISEPHLS